jgi:hypothetical protein
MDIQSILCTIGIHGKGNIAYVGGSDRTKYCIECKREIRTINWHRIWYKIEDMWDSIDGIVIPMLIVIAVVVFLVLLVFGVSKLVTTYNINICYTYAMSVHMGYAIDGDGNCSLIYKGLVVPIDIIKFILAHPGILQ